MKMNQTPVILGILLVCMPASVCPALEVPPDLRTDRWMGVYYGDQKAGYEHRAVGRVKFRDHDAYRYSRELKVCVEVDRSQVTVSFNTTVYIDDHCSPIYEISRQVTDKQGEPKSTQVVQVNYTRDAIVCRIDSDGKVSEKRVSVPNGMDFSVSYAKSFGCLRLSVGDIVYYSVFDSQSQSIRTGRFSALRREKLNLDDVIYDTLVVEDSGNGSTSWQLDSGEGIKLENCGSNMVLYTQSEQQAKADIKAGRCEVLIKPDRPILEPRKVAELTARLHPVLNRRLLSSVPGQSVTYDPQKHVIGLKVVATTYNASKSLSLPIRDEAYATWLAEAPGIETKDRTIRKQARKIIGSETNAYTVAAKLRAWVRAHVNCGCRAETRPPLSAADILKAKMGCCAELSTLYTALARASGIPTRFVQGLLYDEGMFYPHMWTESFVGEWVAFDPSIGDDFVDATHLTFDVLGQPTSWMKALPGVTIEIVDYKYLSGAASTSQSK